MNDDTSFETHRQHEAKDYILKMRSLIAEQDAEIERLNAEVEEQRKTAESVRKLYEGLPERYDRLDEGYTELKALCIRAAEMLDVTTQFLLVSDVPLEWEENKRQENRKLIAELRKAAE